MGYWGSVFKEAWRETKEPFGWTKKTAAAVLIALGTIIAALLSLGTAAMTETAAGYFWIGFGPIFAGMVLFAWNFAEAQSKLYASQVRENAVLRVLLAKYDEPEPNYEAWRRVKELTLHKAACLWYDIEPRVSIPPHVSAWLEALESAVKTGDLDFSPDSQEQREKACSETKVTRKQLQDFAKKHGYDPVFLRD
jgi:hypothetical protein